MDKILVETSARHVHLTEEHIKALFGEGASLTHKKDLSQPGCRPQKVDSQRHNPRPRKTRISGGGITYRRENPRRDRPGA